MKNFLFILGLLVGTVSFAQSPQTLEIFKNQPVNFQGDEGKSPGVERLQDGRIIYKKVQAPQFEEGTDVKVKMTLRSAGDPWDKSGSVFVITDPEKIDVIDVAMGQGTYPPGAAVLEYPGVRKSENYTPALEILRFMTPFGAGYFSDEKVAEDRKYSRPVYIPKWEDKVVWEEDISHLAGEVTGDFYVGVWIDTWTAEGYNIDLSLEYSGRPLPMRKVIPLVNTIYYAGQKHPDLFAKTDLKVDFELPEDASNVQLHYITTGHGGHRGGDEFIRLKNEVKLNQRLVLDTIPWRDDCASFRRFNPSSGVWMRKDTAYVYNRNGQKEERVIEERLASSDLSRSNWCPGSSVSPYTLQIGSLEKGLHFLEIAIDGTIIEDDKLNHWLVSAYLTYL